MPRSKRQIFELEVHPAWNPHLPGLLEARGIISGLIAKA